MKDTKNLRLRGILAARAETPSEAVNQVLAGLNDSFSDFKQRHSNEVSDLTKFVEAQAAKIDAMRVGADAGSASIHPGAGIRGGARHVPVIDSEVANDFRSQMLGQPNATMTTQSNPDGGYTVSPDIDNVIDGVLRDISPMRSVARTVQIADNKGHWEKIIGRTGAQSAWAGEEDDRGETDTGALGKIEVHTHEQYAIPMLTNIVLEDSGFDLQAFLNEDVSGEFSLTEGEAFVTGNGVKKPRGFLTYDATTELDAARDFGTLQYIPTGVDGDFAASDPADILFDLVTSLRPVYRRGSGVAFMMNSATANVIRKFKDANGRFMWVDSITAGQPDRLCGYPVVIDEGMPDIASDAFAVAFGDWQRGYAVVDKPGLRLITDRVTKKGWTKLYFSRRVGGGVVDSNAIKLLKFSAS